MSLRTRIALVVGLTVLVASAVGGIGTSLSSRNVGIDRVDQALRNDAVVFEPDAPRLERQLMFAFEARQAACTRDDPEGLTTEADDNPVRGAVRRFALLPEFASNMQLLRLDGRTVAACQVLPITAEDQAIAAAGEGQAFRSATVEGERFRVLTQGYPDIGAVQFARSLEITQDTLRSLLWRTLGFGVLGAILAGSLGWIFARRATAPLTELSDTAKRVAQTQDLDERITVQGDDEIEGLATSFNTMLSSLATSREQQQRLVQDASHELRTPLTSIRTNVELLQRHQGIDTELQQQVLADISDELHELTALTSEIVDSASAVPTALEDADDVDLVDVVNDCVERARRRHDRAIEVTIEPAASTLVRADAGLMSRCVTNLINNAVKFSEPGTELVVAIGHGSVTVRDRGTGIADHDLPHIFDRFYRATSARSAPGSGLGLAIVKQIVEGYGGTVGAANRENGGAEIGFVLPVVEG